MWEKLTQHKLALTIGAVILIEVVPKIRTGC